MTTAEQPARPASPGPETVANNGVITGKNLAKFEDDGANIVSGVYGDSTSGETNNLVIWCLKPGQENSTQWHENISHIFIINEGEGTYMSGPAFKAPEEAPEATAESMDYKPTLTPIKAGDIIVIPKQTVHGIRNTGNTNLSYIAVSMGGPYGRINVGAQVASHTRTPRP